MAGPHDPLRSEDWSTVRSALDTIAATECVWEPATTPSSSRWRLATPIAERIRGVHRASAALRLSTLAGHLDGAESLELRPCPAFAATTVGRAGARVRIDVSGLPSAPCDLEPLHALAQVRVLVVRAGIGVANLNPIPGMVGLRRLHLEDCTPGLDLDLLAAVPGLEHLFLQPGGDRRQVPPLDRFTRLRTLTLGRWPSLVDLDPLETLSDLEELDLRGASQLYDLRPIRGLRRLAVLNLEDCHRVREEDLQDLLDAGWHNGSGHPAGWRDTPGVVGCRSFSRATSLTAAEAAREVARAALGGPLVLDALDTLSEPAARALSLALCPVSLNGLTALSEEAAAAVVLAGGLSLDGLAALPPPLAAILARCPGPLSLRGVTRLPLRSAVALSGHVGALILDGVTSLPDTTAVALSGHRGSLSLNAITTLSDAAAIALCRGQELPEFDDDEWYWRARRNEPIRLHSLRSVPRRGAAAIVRHGRVQLGPAGLGIIAAGAPACVVQSEGRRGPWAGLNRAFTRFRDPEGENDGPVRPELVDWVAGFEDPEAPRSWNSWDAEDHWVDWRDLDWTDWAEVDAADWEEWERREAGEPVGGDDPAESLPLAEPVRGGGGRGASGVRQGGAVVRRGAARRGRGGANTDRPDPRPGTATQVAPPAAEPWWPDAGLDPALFQVFQRLLRVFVERTAFKEPTDATRKTLHGLAALAADWVGSPRDWHPPVESEERQRRGLVQSLLAGPRAGALPRAVPGWLERVLDAPDVSHPEAFRASWEVQLYLWFAQGRDGTFLPSLPWDLTREALDEALLAPSDLSARAALAYGLMRRSGADVERARAVVVASGESELASPHAREFYVWAARSRSLDVSDSPLIAQYFRERQAPTPGHDDARLLAAVHADPDDMDSRAVYADYLTFRGDPRGEFIALGLAALGAGPTDPTRADALWRAHGPEWYAPLVRVLNFETSRCRAGFLDQVRTKRSGAFDPGVIGAPCWQTVRSVCVAGAHPNLMRALTHSTCRHVRLVQGLDERAYGRLDGATLPWTSLSLSWRACSVRLAQEPAFPSLHQLILERCPGRAWRSPRWDAMLATLFEGRRLGAGAWAAAGELILEEANQWGTVTLGGDRQESPTLAMLAAMPRLLRVEQRGAYTWVREGPAAPWVRA